MINLIVENSNFQPASFLKKAPVRVSYRLYYFIDYQFGRWKISQPDGVSINQLLRNSKILLPKPEAPQRNEELEARLKKLKIQQQEREYNKMVENLHTVKSSTGSVRVPMVSGLNFAVTVIACVFASSFVLKNLVSDFLLRCAIGFAVGIVLMCIEIFLSVRAVMKQEDEEEMRKKKR